jgi:putative DNA primase/helicase
MISDSRRFRKAEPCPICHGYEEAPRGRGQRCHGFLADDGLYAHCSREEHAGSLKPDPNGSTFAHRLVGDCKCGVRHDPSPDDRSSHNGHEKRRIAATYAYVDEQGTLLYEVVRYAHPKDFRQRRPDGQDGWIWNLRGVRRVLYRLPEVLEAIALEQTICAAEGEADAEALRTRGYTATCNPMGAKKWRDEYSQTLEGAADVVIFGDHDDDGRAHVAQVNASLRSVGLTPRIAKMDGLPEHGDVRDWLKTHSQEDLDRVVAAAPPFTPDESDETQEQPPERPLLIQADTVKAQAIQWLWEPYLPRGMLVILDGDPGLGKGLMLVQVAANLSRGWLFLDQLGKPTLMADVEGPQSTLILSAEDSLAHVMIPRLTRAKADLSRITFLRAWLGPEDDEHAFTLQHLPVLIQAIEDVKPVLVILDPLVAYLGDIDMYRANETRPVMAALTQLAERSGCTILGVRHPGKMDQGGRLMYRGQGNMDIIGAARSGLWVQPHPTHPETQTLLLQSKSNVGPLGRTVMFSRDKGEFDWIGVSRLTESMLTGKGPDPWAMLEAFFWLEETMTPGMPYASDKLAKDALEQEISERTLKRTKKLLNIRSVKRGDDWYWILPSLSL